MKRLYVLFCLLCLGTLALPLQARTPSPAPQDKNSAITLNLRDVDIRTLITTVSKATGINFVVDPRVRGNVTVVSSTPMNGEALYQVFLSVLDVNGYSAEPSGQVVKIVPSANARQNALLHGHGEDMVTRVIPVENVPVAQIVPTLRPLIPQNGLLAAYAPNNMLIVTGRARNVKRIRQLVAQLDQPDNSRIQVVQLKHASASDLAQLLNSLDTGGGQAKSGMATMAHVVADTRTNSLLLSGDAAARQRLVSVIESLDAPTPTEGNTHVWFLRYADASAIAKILRKIVTSGEHAADTGKAAPEIPVSIQAEKSSNALIVTGPPDKIRDLHEVVRQLDFRPKEVLIDAIIAEVSGNLAKQLGAQIAVLPSEGSDKGPAAITNFNAGSLPLSTLAQGTAAAAGAGPGLYLGFGRFAAGHTRYGLLLNALNSNSSTNVLSTPSILTLDNKAARIVVGQNVPFVTGSYSTTGTGLAQNNSSNAEGVNTGLVSSPFQTINRRDVGITLKVTPQINVGDSVRLQINLTVSSLAPSVKGAADLVTNKRQIKTEVITDSDSIISLGGLIKDSYTDARQRVPFLSRIPLLGHLFRSRSRERDKTNLMIFLHPVILSDQKLANAYTQQKYRILRAQQLYDSLRHGHHPSAGQSLNGGPTLPADLRQLAPKPGSALKTPPSAGGQDNPEARHTDASQGH